MTENKHAREHQEAPEQPVVVHGDHNFVQSYERPKKALKRSETSV